jgi:hypothetical protein
MEPGGLRLELSMDTSAQLVSVTRRFVEEALEKISSDADLVSRVAMSAHELLENATKYARRGRAQLSVHVEGERTGTRTLTLRLSNTTTATHIDRLRQVFSEIDATDDPLALYVTLMRRNAHERDISGLGLARIRAEGEMTLKLNIDGETATIVARTELTAGAAT